MKRRRGFLIYPAFLLAMLLTISLFAVSKSENGTSSEKRAAGIRKLTAPKPSPPARKQKATGNENPQQRPAGRDPFRTLAVRGNGDLTLPVLPGKRGLRVEQLQVKGIVRTEKQYMAIVVGRQSSAALFLHKDDQLSDGRVVAINEDSVLFQERAVDPLGKPFTRDVLKRISGSGGVNQ